MRRRGLAGFVRKEKPLTAWESAELRPLLLRCLGVIFLVFAGMRYLWSMGSQNQDLGRVEWSTEWLFSMPASARKLFGAQILGHTLVDPFSWIAAVPFLATDYYWAGLSWGWIALGAVFNSLCLGAIMASLRIGTETFLRKRLAPARLKNLQALFTVTGICLLFFLIGLGRSPQLLSWVLRAARGGSALLISNPFSLPAALFAAPRAAALAAELAGAAAISLGMIASCAYLVRNELIATPGVYLGARGSTRAGRDFLPPGIVGKDLRLLLRDRNFCVQTLVAPILVVGFQIFFNSGMAAAISSDFHRAATFAFGIGAYVLVSTGLTVLSVEGNSLWMLYGLPVPLHEIMLRKTALWAALAALYTAVALVVCGIHIRALNAGDFSYAAVALAGVVIFAFIAAGIGMLSTDPLEVEVKRRIRPGMVYLYMILASLYGYALYAPSAWKRVGEIVLSSLLAYALWQKVKDRTPFLLDAVSVPPPQVSLADGLMAALGFFVLQGVFSARIAHHENAAGRSVDNRLRGSRRAGGGVHAVQLLAARRGRSFFHLGIRRAQERTARAGGGFGNRARSGRGRTGGGVLSGRGFAAAVEGVSQKRAPDSGSEGLVARGPGRGSRSPFRGIHFSRAGFSRVAALAAGPLVHPGQRRGLRRVPPAHGGRAGLCHGFSGRVGIRGHRMDRYAHLRAHDLQCARAAGRSVAARRPLIYPSRASGGRCV